MSEKQIDDGGPAFPYREIDANGQYRDHFGAGLIAARRQAEKAGIDVVVTPETPKPPAFSWAGCIYEFRRNEPVPFLEKCRSEPWRKERKDKKYK